MARNYECQYWRYVPRRTGHWQTYGSTGDQKTFTNENTSLNTNAPQPQRSDNLSSTNEIKPQHPNPSNNEQRSYNLDTPPSYQNQQPQYQPARPPSQNTPYRNDYKSNEENTDNKTNENTDNKTEEKSADNSDSKTKKKKKTKKHVKKEEVDSSLLTNQTKRGALKKKKKKIKPTPKIKTVSSDLKSESKDDNENIAEKSDSVAALDKNVDSSLVPPKKQSAFKKLTSSEVREKQKRRDY